MVARVFGPAAFALIAAALLSWLTPWRIPSINEAIAGVSITGGLLFGLLVFTFQLRLQVSHDPRTQQRLQVPRLIDQLFGTVVVATVVAGALVLALLIAGATSGPPLFGIQAPLHWGWSLALLPLTAFYFTLLFSIIGRVRTAYRAAVSGNEVRSR